MKHENIVFKQYFSEIAHFGVNKKFIKNVYQIPIDTRFLQIENIIQKAKDREYGKQENFIFDKLIPLSNSFYFIFNFIRSIIAMSSDYESLFISPHSKMSGKSPTWSFLPPKNDCIFRTSDNLIKHSNIGDYITDQEAANLEDLLASIEDDIVSNEELSNKVLLMEINGYIINVYSLGSILEYRMLELDNAILKLPKKYPTEYVNTSSKSVCSSTYKVYWT